VRDTNLWRKESDAGTIVAVGAMILLDQNPFDRFLPTMRVAGKWRTRSSALQPFAMLETRHRIFTGKLDL
jgi:hypothetical protein